MRKFLNNLLDSFCSTVFYLTRVTSNFIIHGLPVLELPKWNGGYFKAWTRIAIYNISKRSGLSENVLHYILSPMTGIILLRMGWMTLPNRARWSGCQNPPSFGNSSIHDREMDIKWPPRWLWKLCIYSSQFGMKTRTILFSQMYFSGRFILLQYPVFHAQFFQETISWLCFNRTVAPFLYCTDK